MTLNATTIQPKISLILPVYQNEATLYECLISVVAQKFNETEIIAVDDGSTDQSRSILETFAKAYPEKIKCIFFDEHRGLDAACWAGTEASAAPFVTFVIPDGIANGLLCDQLIAQAEAEETDILFYPYVKCNPATDALTSVVPSTKKLAQSDLIKSENISFWFALFRKSFLMENKDVAFTQLKHANAVVMPQLIARTDRFGSVKRAGLFLQYESSKMNVTFASEQEVQEAIAADALVWERVPETLRTDLASHYSRLFSARLKDEPAVYDKWVQRGKKMAEHLSAYHPENSASTAKLLDTLSTLPQDALIPKIVYVNGFMKQQIVHFDRYLEQAKKAYLFDPLVIVLDEETCDTAALPTWLQNASPEDKGLYFAIEKISQTGGMYLSPMVEVITSFNREVYDEAFFVAGAAHQALPYVFGGRAGHPAFLNLLEMLRQERLEPSFATVAGRMTCELVRDTGVHLNGKMETGLWGLRILPFEMVCRTANLASAYSQLNYSNLHMDMSDMVCLPRELEAMAWETAGKLQPKGSKAGNGSQKQTLAQEELLQIKSSKAWKMVTRLYATRDAIVNKVRNVMRKLRGKK